VLTRLGLILLASCASLPGTDDPSPTEQDDPSGPFSCQGFTATSPEIQVTTLAGEITWNVDFYPSAEAEGYTDCAYSRQFDGIQDQSVAHLCPHCEQVFKSDVTLIDGLDDCYIQIASGSPAPQEWIGWTADDGADGRRFQRAPLNVPLYDAGLATVDGLSITTSYQVDYPEPEQGPAFSFDIQGQLTLGDALGDPQHGFTPPVDEYAGGWPVSHLAEYTGDYVMRLGEELPDAVFLDQCGQPTRLHDFHGQHLVLAMSALNCPPCQAMSEDEPAFIEQMAGHGVQVEAITLMAPSLDDVLGPTSPSDLLAWTETYDLTSPILQDRGYGLWMLGDLTGTYGTYPTWIVIDPQLNLLAAGSGYGSWDPIEDQILADLSR